MANFYGRNIWFFIFIFYEFKNPSSLKRERRKTRDNLELRRTYENDSVFKTGKTKKTYLAGKENSIL